MDYITNNNKKEEDVRDEHNRLEEWHTQWKSSIFFNVC